MNKHKLKKLNQTGEFNFLILALILAIIGMIAALVMAFMYYGKFTDQRDKNQPVIDAAVEEAKEEQKTQLQAEFDEEYKKPNKSYSAPGQYGSVKVFYPKTWGSYVKETNTGLDFYAHPNFVPADGVNYALRMSVVSRQFANEMKTYDAKIKNGDLKASALTVSGVSGTRLDGTFERDQSGSMVIFPLRDKTLRVWTETNNFKGDFDNIALKNLTFVP